MQHVDHITNSKENKLLDIINNGIKTRATTSVRDAWTEAGIPAADPTKPPPLTYP